MSCMKTPCSVCAERVVAKRRRASAVTRMARSLAQTISQQGDGFTRRRGEAEKRSSAISAAPREMVPCGFSRRREARIGDELSIGQRAQKLREVGAVGGVERELPRDHVSF